MLSLYCSFLSWLSCIWLKRLWGLQKDGDKSSQTPMQDWFSPCNPSDISVIVFGVTYVKNSLYEMIRPGYTVFSGLHKIRIKN